jgi:hypothetical protein
MKLAIRLVVTVLLALVAKRLAFHWYGVSSLSVSWPIDIAAWSAAFVASYAVVLLLERTVVAPLMKRSRA